MLINSTWVITETLRLNNGPIRQNIIHLLKHHVKSSVYTHYIEHQFLFWQLDKIKTAKSHLCFPVRECLILYNNTLWLICVLDMVKDDFFLNYTRILI